MKIIRFEILNSGSDSVNRLPSGVTGNKSLMMWKELCRTGHYETDGTEHDIEEPFFTDMVQSFMHRRAKGVEVPCPLGHTHDPEHPEKMKIGRKALVFATLRKK